MAQTGRAASVSVGFHHCDGLRAMTGAHAREQEMPRKSPPKRKPPSRSAKSKAMPGTGRRNLEAEYATFLERARAAESSGDGKDFGAPDKAPDAKKRT